MKYGYQDWRTSLGHALILFVFTIGGAILLSAFLFRFFERPCTGLRERVAPSVAKILKPSQEGSS
jgi:peptidoglycan/LPS O-acetylase OafA/YrhL